MAETPETPPLRLLSLDGGGVGSLSSLLILDTIMRKINAECPPKPCDVFDLIGGTGTGGIIALMLGRLHMDTQSCMNAFFGIPTSVFAKKISLFPVSATSKRKPHFEGIRVQMAIKKLCLEAGLDEDALLFEGDHAQCRTFLCMRVDDDQILRLANYPLPGNDEHRSVKIWEAARATSAASSYFQPMKRSGQEYPDANNPVREVIQAAQELWPEGPATYHNECLISLGAGVQDIEQKPNIISRMLEVALLRSSSSEAVAEEFLRENRNMFLNNRYFRFSVSQVLDSIDYSWMDITTAARRYLQKTVVNQQLDYAADLLARLQEKSLSQAPHDVRKIYLSLQEPSDSKKPYMFRKSTEVAPRTEKEAHLEPESSSASQPPTIALDKARYDILTQLSNHFARDPTLRVLCVAALERVGDERFERNFAALLRVFARTIRTRLSNAGESKIALVTYANSSDIASMVKMQLDELVQTSRSAAPPTYDDVIALRDQIEDIDEVSLDASASSLVLINSRNELFFHIKTEDFSDLLTAPGMEELRHNMRIFVFPTIKQYIQANMEGAWTTGVEISRVACKVDWELDQFRTQELDPEDDIAPILTISGRPNHAEAAPCLDYMSQTWPETGEKLFRGLLDLSESKYNSCSIQHSPDHSVLLSRRGNPETYHSYKTFGGGLDVEICGTLAKVVETIEQFAWLTAALRPPSNNYLLQSTSHIEFRVTAAPPEFPYILTSLYPLPLQSESLRFPDSLGTCWRTLFRKSVLAWGFPTKERVEGLGLELPFHLMTTMAGVKFPVEFQGGIILKSTSETLLPVAKLQVGIQWHRIEGKDSKLFLETMKAIPKWYQTKNLDELIASRTFLGLYGHAQVCLGTSASNIQPSEVPEDRKWIRVGEEVPLNLTLRLPWVASFGASPKIILPKSQRKQITDNEIGYEQSLQRSKRSPLLLYDVGSRTGWLVPELSIILHLALANAAMVEPQPKTLKKLQYAKPLADGGAAALDAITSCDHVILWKGRNQENKPYRFMDIVMHYMDLFENRKQEQELKRSSYELSAFLGLRGWDFVSLRDNAYFFSPRSLPAPKFGTPPTWWDIGKESQALVIFGRNLEQVIIPNRTQIRVCSAWQSAPPNADLLITTVSCLQTLALNYQSELPNYKFSKELVWNRPQGSRLFEECTGSCNPVQKMWKMGPLNLIRRRTTHANNPGVMMEEGAVVFGKRKNVEKYISENTPCHPLDFVAEEQHLIEVSEFLALCRKKPSLLIPVLVVLVSVFWVYWEG